MKDYSQVAGLVDCIALLYYLIRTRATDLSVLMLFLKPTFGGGGGGR